MTNKIRDFVRSLPTADAADLDPLKRTAAELEIERRVGALSPADRATFEKELRTMAREQDESMSFEQKWTAARHHAALKEQIEGSK
ncbi:MAG: hypothetical protein U1E20_06240 [Methylocystis sp.]|uniref:hypothetical protein n=1 Tax=Methylocystis sp. TaxID=1911079 RepID=UPI00392DD6F2